MILILFIVFLVTCQVLDEAGFSEWGFKRRITVAVVLSLIFGIAAAILW